MAITGVNAGNSISDALPQALLDVYSLDILHKAQGIMRFEEFAFRKQEMNGAPGENIKFTIYNDIDRGGELDEGTSLSGKAMSATQKTIKLTEWGNAIKVSEKLLRMSWDDVMSEAATLLGRDYALVRDIALRDALAGGVSGQILANPNGSVQADLTATDVFDVESIRVAVEQLQTADAPKILGDFYVCFIHPHQAASLRRDTDWVSAHQYAGSRNLFNGEIGRWEDVVFIQTTHARNGAAAPNAPGFSQDFSAGFQPQGATAPNQVALYESLVFGDQCLFIADSLPVELRDNGVEDFGRTHGLAWYSIFGCDVLNPEYAVSILSA